MAIRTRDGDFRPAVDAASAGLTAMVETSSGFIRSSRSSAGNAGIPTYMKITPETNQITNTALSAMPSHRCV